MEKKNGERVCFDYPFFHYSRTLIAELQAVRARRQPEGADTQSATAATGLAPYLLFCRSAYYRFPECVGRQWITMTYADQTRICDVLSTIAEINPQFCDVISTIVEVNTQVCGVIVTIFKVTTHDCIKAGIANAENGFHLTKKDAPHCNLPGGASWSSIKFVATEAHGLFPRIS